MQLLGCYMILFLGQECFCFNSNAAGKTDMDQVDQKLVRMCVLAHLSRVTLGRNQEGRYSLCLPCSRPQLESPQASL